jgi:hypothetical protein
MDNQSPKEPGMASQATYQITAKGKLDQHWAEWFNGSIVRIEHSKTGNPHTILTCRVKDQAQLLGILNRLNSLNLPLLQVAFVRTEDEKHVLQQPNINQNQK